MINFPTIEKLEVAGYSLYQRDASSKPLSKSFGSGPWVVLGVNGLGKSTLLLLIRHLLLGRARVRPPGFYGGKDTDLLSSDSRIFAARVGDEARNAHAKLVTRFGRKTLSVTRSLHDLSLQAFSSSDKTLTSSNQSEEEYRSALCHLLGIEDFANVVRVFDRCLFSLEDRTTLVWNVNAQYEVFKALLLDAKTAQKLRKREGEIISADSQARNLNSIIVSMINRRNKALKQQGNAAVVAAQISQHTARADKLQIELVAKQQELEELLTVRHDKLTKFLRAERDLDERAASYENLKLSVLSDALKPFTTNEQYTLLKLIATKVCPACGQQAAHAATHYEKRTEKDQCILCGSEKKSPHVSKKEQNKLEASYKQLLEARAAYSESRLQHQEASDNYINAERQHQGLTAEVAKLDVILRRLKGQLPPSDQALIQKDEGQIQVMRDQVRLFQDERTEAERKLAKLLTKLTGAVLASRKKIETRFAAHASVFFGSQARLVYAPRRQRVGQSGEVQEFPAFEVEMIGSTTDGSFARRTQVQVSLSQSFYLDLAFRMAVIETVGSHGGLLVIDGPETSVDAVFAELAGRLLAQYANDYRRKANQVIVACNVVEGAFIPNFLRGHTTKPSRLARTVNLLKISKPTPALEAQFKKYEEAVSEIFSIGVKA